MKNLKGHESCCMSTSIDDETLTFGSGKLDHFGFWQYPCYKCAREYERRSPGTKCWPPEKSFLKITSRSLSM